MHYEPLYVYKVSTYVQNIVRMVLLKDVADAFYTLVILQSYLT